MKHRFSVEAKKRLNMLVQETINRCHGLMDKADAMQNLALRTFVQSAAARTADFCQLFTQIPRMDATRVEGALGHVIYVGENDADKVALLETLFPDGYTETDLGRVSLWKLPVLTQDWLQDNDLVVCRVSNFFPWRIPAVYAFANPLQVNQVARLAETVEEMLAGHPMRHARREISRMEKHKLSVRFSHSPEDLELFYHRMYAPTARHRHQKHAVVMPYHFFQELFQKGFIEFLALDGQDIVAGINKIEDGTYHFSSMGLMDGNREWLKYDVNVGLYWYGMKYAIEAGVPYANLGISNAWVSDGVFHFKTMWRTRVEPYRYIRDQLLVRANNLSPEWQERLNQIGFINRINHQYLRVYINPPASSLQELSDLAIKDGLDGIQVVRADESQNFIPDGLVEQSTG
jgi:Acetyltransferase (GNAT) domain